MSVSRIGNNIFQALNYRSIGNPNALAHSVSKWVRANMRAGISEKSIWATHHADKKLFGFSIHHDLILTCSKGGSISCLDFRTGQKKWTHSDPSVNWDREIFIMSDKDRVIYLGFLKNEPATIFKKFIIQILSLNSGEKIKDIVIKHYHQVTITIAEEIFARVGDKIGQWDLNGKFIRAISLPGLSTFDICPLFMCQQQLVIQTKKSIKIVDTNKLTYIEHPIKTEISALYIDKFQRIFCGLQRDATTEHALYVYHSEKKQGKYYPTNGAFLKRDWNHESQQAEWNEQGEPFAIEVHKDSAYIGDSTGALVMIDLMANESIRLATHTRMVSCLSIENGIMATASMDEIMVWDLSNHTLLRKIDKIGKISQIHLHQGTLIASVEASLVVWNYLTSQKEEQLTKNSAKAIEPATLASREDLLNIHQSDEFYEFKA